MKLFHCLPYGMCTVRFLFTIIYTWYFWFYYSKALSHYNNFSTVLLAFIFPYDSFSTDLLMLHMCCDERRLISFFMFAIINPLWYFRQRMSSRLLLLKGTSAERKWLFWSDNLVNLFTNYSTNWVRRYIWTNCTVASSNVMLQLINMLVYTYRSHHSWYEDNVSCVYELSPRAFSE